MKYRHIENGSLKMSIYGSNDGWKCVILATYLRKFAVLFADASLLNGLLEFIVCYPAILSPNENQAR